MQTSTRWAAAMLAIGLSVTTAQAHPAFWPGPGVGSGAAVAPSLIPVDVRPLPPRRVVRIAPSPRVVVRAPLARGVVVPARNVYYVTHPVRYGLPVPRPGLRYAVYHDHLYLVDEDTLAIVAFVGATAAVIAAAH